VHHDNAKSYTNEQRAKIVALSFPAINKKWGKGLISRAGNATMKAGAYINNY
jgi:hypothetical protein